MLASTMMWLFSQGHEDRYTIYVHASREKTVHTSALFIGRDIRSEKVSAFTFLTISFPSYNQGAAAGTLLWELSQRDPKR